MAIVRVVEVVVIVSVLRRFDAGSGEGPLHLIKEVCAPPPAVFQTPPFMKSCEHVVELEEDPAAPEGRIGLLSGELQEKIAL
jgi:hypothetical protein